MQPLYGIYGAGGCGRGIMPLARAQLQRLGVAPQRLVFVVDAAYAAPPAINGCPVLTYPAFCASPASVRHIAVAVADSRAREQMVQRCTADDMRFFEVRADNVVQMDDVQIGEGALISPFVTFTSNLRIGRHFHANLYSYVEHDCVVGDYVTFAPGVRCNGGVTIADHAYIGSGAIIKPGVTIGAGAVVGMGAVVIRDVAPETTVAGNPARVLARS